MRTRTGSARYAPPAGTPSCAARGRVPIRLLEVEAGHRAPILRRYLAVAPGARPHIPVDRHAPLTEFARIADRYPVVRIVTSD